MKLAFQNFLRPWLKILTRQIKGICTFIATRWTNSNSTTTLKQRIRVLSRLLFARRPQEIQPFLSPTLPLRNKQPVATKGGDDIGSTMVRQSFNVGKEILTLYLKKLPHWIELYAIRMNYAIPVIVENHLRPNNPWARKWKRTKTGIFTWKNREVSRSSQEEEGEDFHQQKSTRTNWIFWVVLQNLYYRHHLSCQTIHPWEFWLGKGI